MKNLTTIPSKNLNPWSVFKDDLWDLFDSFSKEMDVPAVGGVDQFSQFSPKIELKDTDKAYKICAEIPGMDEKDITVTLQDNVLVLEGEKKKETKSEDKSKGVFHSEFSYGRFYRAIPLSDDINPDKVEASYKNGVLNVEVEKNPAKARKSKKIQIGSGASSSQPETKH